jgi:hypothetical protein
MTHQIALPLPFAAFTADQPLLPVCTPEKRVCRGTRAATGFKQHPADRIARAPYARIVTLHVRRLKTHVSAGFNLMNLRCATAHAAA